MTLPQGFTADADGVWRFHQNGMRQWLCEPFAVHSECWSHTGEGRAWELHWVEPRSGIERRAVIPRTALHKGKTALAIELERAGIKVDADEVVYNLLRHMFSKL
jgi:hypothetical protein